MTGCEPTATGPCHRIVVAPNPLPQGLLSMTFELTAEQREERSRQQDLDAVSEAIADMQAGRVAPLDEAFERIRTNLGLPQNQ